MPARRINPNDLVKAVNANPGLTLVAYSDAINCNESSIKYTKNQLAMKGKLVVEQVACNRTRIWPAGTVLEKRVKPVKKVNTKAAMRVESVNKKAARMARFMRTAII